MCYGLCFSEVESRTQGSRPRPRTQKNFEAKAKDRPSRGQDQGPRTQTQVFSKKKGLQKFFSGEKGLQNFFSSDLYLRKPKKKSLQIFRKVSGVFQQNFNGSKMVLSSSRGQGNFRGLEASRPRPKTSKRVLEDIPDAKDVLEDSTSGVFCSADCSAIVFLHLTFNVTFCFISKFGHRVHKLVTRFFRVHHNKTG